MRRGFGVFFSVFAVTFGLGAVYGIGQFFFDSTLVEGEHGVVLALAGFSALLAVMFGAAAMWLFHDDHTTHTPEQPPAKEGVL